MAVYSHSRLDTFRKCPRQFYYRYIAKLPLDKSPEQIATFLGSRCHEALEHLNEQVHHHRIPSLEEVVEFFRNGWKLNGTKEIVIQDEGLCLPDGVSLPFCPQLDRAAASWLQIAP